LCENIVLLCDIEGLLVFLCIYAIKYGAPSLIDVVDRVQAKLVFVFAASNLQLTFDIVRCAA